MITDAFLSFDSAIPGSSLTVGTVTSTNVLDLGVGRDLGSCEPPLEILVTIAGSLGGTISSTLQINIQAAPDNGSGAPGTWYVLDQSSVYTQPSLATNMQVFRDRLPVLPLWPHTAADGFALPRFLRLQYVTAGAAWTTGTVSASLTIGRQNNVTYPSGIVVLN